MKMRGAMQVGGGTNPVGNQAATFTTNRPPSPVAGGMDNPRMIIFWLAAFAVLLVFHVGGARLP